MNLKDQFAVFSAFLQLNNNKLRVALYLSS